MKKLYAFLCLLLALSLSLPGVAQNMRYQQNIKGGFAVAANSLTANILGYTNTAGGTTMSSSSDLVLPPGSTIIKAYLYVERYESALFTSGTPITTVKFRVPGGSYITYTTASAGFVGNPFNANYQQFIVDVTSAIPAVNAFVTTVTAGGDPSGAGRYSVADAPPLSNYGYGWSLYVVYTNPASKFRNVSIFDATLRYPGSTGTFTINNIIVPSAGPINANLGVTGCWGDIGLTDMISFGKDGGPYTNLTDPYQNTTTDIMNSSIAKAAGNNVSADGGPAMSGNFTARNPYVYGSSNWSSYNYDADIINASGILPNSTTPINVRITQTSGGSDVLGSGAYGLSIDIAAAVLTKSVAPASICDGDTATYFFKITNKEQGALAQAGIAFTDNMPSGLRAIPGSGTITGGSGGTVTATATAISVSGLSLAINDSAIIAVKVTNIAGQTNPSCSANPAAFTNGFNNISGISNNLVNNITSQCLEVTSRQTSAFTQVGPYCQGAVIPALPTTSNNGITGSWSPAINNTATTTYTFTPAAGQCGTATTMTIAVNAGTLPVFSQLGPYCAGASIPALPTTSGNGVSGTWSPAINNTTTTTYTFTPTPVAGQCYLPTTMTITVNPNVTPAFAQVGPYCPGALISALPTTSGNGIHGSWSPAINNTATTTYTFSPSVGQCAVPSNMTVTIKDRIYNTANVTICQGKTYTFNGVTYTTSQSGLKDTFTTAGCDSIVTLNLNVTPYPTGTDVRTICQGKTYTFNGITYSTPQTGLKDTFQTTAGCDSIVTLNLNVTPYPTGTDVKTICHGRSYVFNGITYTTANNTAKDTFQTASGCDSIVTLNLTVTPYLTGTAHVTICQGKTYTFNGITYSTPQTGLKDTFQTTSGCDSIVTLNLNVTPYPTGTDVRTICQGRSYVFNGVTYTTANNTAKDTFQTAAGCDSIVTLNLTVTPYLTGTAHVTICQGKTYTFNGITYSTPQTGLKDTLQTTSGCDSIVTLNLNVTPYPTGTDVKTICQGRSYVFNGVTYTTANNTAKDTFQTAAGCDSIVTLNLTVTPYLTGTAHVTICQGKTYTFNGITYSTPQTGLKDTLQTTSGCDSIVTLILNVTPYPTGTDVKTICQGQSYVFNGITYTTSNSTAKDTFQTAGGCDSIVTLNLTVTPYLTGTANVTICQGQSYSFNGINYTTSQSGLKDTLVGASGCDSIVTLNLTVTPYLTGTANVTICQGQSYSFNGISYTTSHSGLKDTLVGASGCDSIITLNLTVSPYLTGTDVKTICQGQSYIFNGITYTTSNSTAKDTFQTAGGCDSIVTLNLTVTPYLTGTANVTICQGQSYSFNGISYTTSQSGLKDTLVGASGCDSIVTLNLTVTPYLTGTDVKTICQGQSYVFNGITYTTSNSTAKDTLITSGGCDSIVTLNLTVTPYLTGTANVTICQGQSYSFNGISYTNSQSGLKDTLVGASGCDSIVTLNLTVSPYLTGTDVKTICQGQSYVFNGITYTTSNSTAKDTFQTAGGCDSIVTLNLTVTPYLTGTANVTICQGQSYSFNGISYTTSQSGLKDTLVGTSGCDSIVTLNLMVTPYLTGTDVKTICQGQSYIFNGITYTTSNSTAKDTFQTAGGCDSIVTLNLMVTPYLTGTANVTICQGQSYSFNGISYTTSQSGLKDTLVGASGCDSIVTLNLTVTPYLTGTDVKTICQGQSYIFNGITYTTSNSTAKDTFQTAGGCDSIVTLNLTVTPYLTGTANVTICQGQSYSFNGISYTNSQSGLKDTLVGASGCDSIVTLNLTVSPYLTGTDVKTICQGQSYVFNGITYTTSNSTAKDTFQTAGGCDSIVTLNLTVTPYLTGTVNVTICQGQSYVFNSITYTASNSTAKDTLVTSGGCDSIVTLNLTVTPYLTGTDVKTICQGQSYIFNGITYTISNSTAKDTLITSGGCDSIVTLNLTVSPYLTGTDVKTICQGQSYVFNGITYITSNSTAKDTLVTSGGCDSIVTLNLTVTPYLTGTDAKTICQGQSYSFNGVTYTTANNTAKDTFQTAGGCDSIVTLNLTVSPYLTGTDVKTICQGHGYVFNGITYTASNNTATDTLKTSGGCDSIVTLNLTVAPYLAGIDEQVICEGESYTFNGVAYTTSNTTATDTLQTWSGCDSIVTLNLSISPLPDVRISIDMDRTGPFCTGDTVQLRGSGAKDYTWSDYRGGLGHGETIRLLLTQAGNSYRVLGRDESGCADTTRIVIATEPCCNLNMPNAFSPNGDGLNDEIGPIGNGHPLGYRFRVFNRWGQLVFVSYKLEDRWKGTMNGALVDPGTYFYVIGGTCVDGTPIALHGDITLVR